MKTDLRLLLLAVGLAPIPALASAPETAGIAVAERQTLAAPQVYGRTPPAAPHQLALTAVYFTGGRWSRGDLVAAIRRAVEILEQCGVVLRQLELLRVDAPPRYHYLDTPVSRELAGTLRPAGPAVYFVTDTRHQPAFDAEAIGRGNSGTRPELADSVWVTRATRDTGIALAHELVHVLTDSGEHVDLPGNLMRDETAPENTRLTNAQCARLRDTGANNGLLRQK